MAYLPGNEAVWAIYHRVGGILLASFKLGQGKLAMKN